MIDSYLAACGGFLVAFAAASLVEWVVHVLMHRKLLLGKVHRDHHASGVGDGWFWEFLYYTGAAIPGSIIFLGIAYYYTDWYWLAGGMCTGAFAYAGFAAYAHQVQHERPELVFWMNPPVHTVHHRYEQYRTNFGIGVDVWDKIFGTYERVEWRRDPARQPHSLRDFLHIKWL